MSDVVAKLTTIINEVRMDGKVFSPEDIARASLTKDLGFDSLDLINFFFRVEEAFSIKIPPQDIDDQDLSNIPNLVPYLDERSHRS